jgi:GNAT superfamily N-acetyltransferase
MTASGYTVRLATADDATAMFDLIVELAAYERAPHEVINTAAKLKHDGFERSNPLFKAWVAESSDRVVVAMAICYVRYSTWKGPVLYLEDIVVREALRGNGIGKLLMEACVNECRAMGYKRLTWQVLDWNEPAIRFYERWNAEFDAGWLNASIDF